MVKKEPSIALMVIRTAIIFVLGIYSLVMIIIGGSKLWWLGASPMAISLLVAIVGLSLLMWRKYKLRMSI